jgi:hypothetical protein
MAYSKKVMGKEVGQAGIYAKPHNMSGGAVSIKNANKYKSDPNNMNADESTPGGMPARRVSIGNPGRDDVKNSGIKIRGTGAATKGVMARGPMG